MLALSYDCKEKTRDIFVSRRCFFYMITVCNAWG